ncbi:polysaccharide deacetylase family protein [bacterium]|nr:polysaccharide deacetylase family protein [bacterium]
MTHFLTIDLEDWYHAHYPGFDFRAFKPDERRVEPATERLLELLDKHQTKATFFTLGVIARDFPGLIKRIKDEGHEIACHGWDHDLIDSLPGEFLFNNINRAKELLEDVSGEEVIGFRSPNFSVNPANWNRYLDALDKSGFKYDSSAYAGRLYYGGMDGIANKTGKIEGHELHEFPPSVGRFLIYRFPLGGFYLRFFPVSVMKGAIKRIERRGQRAVLYLHPKDIDGDNPRLPVNAVYNQVHLMGVKKGYTKLNELLSSFNFMRISDYCIDSRSRKVLTPVLSG